MYRQNVALLYFDTLLLFLFRGDEAEEQTRKRLEREKEREIRREKDMRRKAAEAAEAAQ